MSQLALIVVGLVIAALCADVVFSFIEMWEEL